MSRSPALSDLRRLVAPAARAPVELARHALTGPFEGFDAVLLELNLAPGQRNPGPGHRHPGPVVGYVAEGQLALSDRPQKAVLPQFARIH